MSRLLLLLLVLGCTITFFLSASSGASVGGDDVSSLIDDGATNTITKKQTADHPATAPGTAEKKHVLVQAFDTNGDGRLDDAERAKIGSKVLLSV
jgi:uncharacterized membrane protein YebE (DUF533 family)